MVTRVEATAQDPSHDPDVERLAYRTDLGYCNSFVARAWLGDGPAQGLAPRRASAGSGEDFTQGLLTRIDLHGALVPGPAGRTGAHSRPAVTVHGHLGSLIRSGGTV